MLRWLVPLNTLVLFFGFVVGAQAAVPPTFSFSVVKAPHALALDPALLDPAWQAGKVPNDGHWMNVTTRTAVDPVTTYLLYDDKNLYVGFDVRQDGMPIVATQSTNDVGFGTDDFVAVGIDTSGAGSQAYFFETTPKGVRYQQASENARYRPTWQSAASSSGGEWKAVMIIPLDVMRLRGGDAQTWRIGFFRGIASRAEHLSWAYDPIMQDQGGGNWPSFNDLRFWPSASGLAIKAGVAARPQPRAEIYGLSSSGFDREQFQQSDGQFHFQKTRSVGLDLSYPITPTINFVGTVNPDFSNVEVDQQTIAPQEFARQLNEYRPFFAQGAQFLNPNPQPFSSFLGPADLIFYSPSVGPFDRGAKIEGTYGLQSFGLLSYRGYNEVNGDEFDDQAFGYKHALQDQTFQYYADGVLAHHSVLGDDDTFEVGMKGRNLHNKLVYGLQDAVEKSANLPNGIAHSGYGFVDVHQHNYEWLLGYVDKSPNYGPLDGFTSSSDDKGFQGFINFNGSTKNIKNWSVQFFGDRLLDGSGAVHESDTGLFLNATFKNGFSINGAGPQVSILRGYNGNFYTGYPAYDPTTATNVPFDFAGIPIGYRDGTPTPIDASANWGNFGGNWLHYYTLSHSRPLGSRFTLGLEYDSSLERSLSTGVLDSQWLRRISLGFNITPKSNLTLALRAINGHGGFVATPGLNLALAYHRQFSRGDLFINYGSPSANVTLNRLIVKYVFRAGSDQGT